MSPAELALIESDPVAPQCTPGALAGSSAQTRKLGLYRRPFPDRSDMVDVSVLAAGFLRQALRHRSQRLWAAAGDVLYPGRCGLGAGRLGIVAPLIRAAQPSMPRKSSMLACAHRRAAGGFRHVGFEPLAGRGADRRRLRRPSGILRQSLCACRPIFSRAGRAATVVGFGGAAGALGGMLMALMRAMSCRHWQLYADLPLRGLRLSRGAAGGASDRSRLPSRPEHRRHRRD